MSIIGAIEQAVAPDASIASNRTEIEIEVLILQSKLRLQVLEFCLVLK